MWTLKIISFVLIIIGYVLVFSACPRIGTGIAFMHMAGAVLNSIHSVEKISKKK